MNAAVDVGRLVVQCACGRAATWSGEDAARAQGWSRAWAPGPDGELAARWVCADCYQPPAPPPPAPLEMPAYLRDLIGTNQRALAIEQLALLTPEHRAVCLDVIAREAGYQRGNRGPWLAIATHYGRATPAPKRRRAAPAAGKAGRG